jgi:hypothetical protein
VGDDGIEPPTQVVFIKNNADAGRQFFEEKMLRSITELGF